MDECSNMRLFGLDIMVSRGYKSLVNILSVAMVTRACEYEVRSVRVHSGLYSLPIALVPALSTLA